MTRECHLVWNDTLGQGGTANLAVRGGNLPPRALAFLTLLFVPTPSKTVGLVARQNGQVARSTHW
jgi:hypothetical protein